MTEEGAGIEVPHITARPQEGEIPVHLQQVYKNLEVIPLHVSGQHIADRENARADSVKSTAAIAEESDDGKPIKTDTIQEQINEMHRIREEERKPLEIDMMHTQREQERNLAIDAFVLTQTRVGISVVEAWAQTGDISSREIKKMVAFTTQLREFLYGYAETGQAGSSLFIDDAAGEYITPSIAKRIYGGVEAHPMTIDNTPGADVIRKLIATSIGHDFRTPLTSIQGFSQILERPNLPEQLENKAKEKVMKGKYDLIAETAYMHALLEGGFTFDEFTGEQVGEEIKKHLGKDIKLSISEDAKRARISGSENWFQMFFPQVRINTDEQYDIRDKNYPQRVGEVDKQGDLTKGQMSVAIDTFRDADYIKRVQIDIGDYATGFSKDILLKRFSVGRTTKSSQGNTGRTIAASVAAGDKVYDYEVIPQTIISNASGEIERIIESSDIRDPDNAVLVEKHVKWGKVVGERVLEEGEYESIANHPYAGARMRLIARALD